VQSTKPSSESSVRFISGFAGNTKSEPGVRGASASEIGVDAAPPNWPVAAAIAALNTPVSDSNVCGISPAAPPIVGFAVGFSGSNSGGLTACNAGGVTRGIAGTSFGIALLGSSPVGASFDAAGGVNAGGRADDDAGGVNAGGRTDDDAAGGVNAGGRAVDNAAGGVNAGGRAVDDAAGGVNAGGRGDDNAAGGVNAGGRAIGIGGGDTGATGNVATTGAGVGGGTTGDCSVCTNGRGV
jgi:hypothetical protein